MTSEAAPQRSRMGNAFRALSIRNYRLYWYSGLGMTGAQGITQLCLPWLILDLTGSVGQLGIVISMQGVAWTIVALAGGILADRYSRRSLIIASQTFTILNLVILAALTVSDAVTVWQVYLSSLILGTNQALTVPARTAILRSLVGPEEMMNAVALNSMQLHSTRVLWPAVGGFAIGLLGVGPALLTGALCSAIAVIMLLQLRNIVEPPRPPATPALRQISEGISYSFSTPTLRMVMIINFGTAFFGLAFLNIGPGFGREVLNFDATTTGLFIMTSGIGAIAASVGLVFYEVKNRYQFVVATTFGFGLSLVALCANPWTPLAFPIMVCFGFSTSALAVTAQTIFQTDSDPRFLGRVISLWSLGGGIGSLTALPIGLAGDVVGLRWSLGFVSFLLVLVAFYVTIVHLPRALRAATR